MDGIREAGSQPSVEEGAALDDFKGVLCLGTIRPGPVGEMPDPLLPGPHDDGLSANLADEAALPGLLPELPGAVDAVFPQEDHLLTPFRPDGAQHLSPPLCYDQL